jgi:hypothetical protein
MYATIARDDQIASYEGGLVIKYRTAANQPWRPVEPDPPPPE